MANTSTEKATFKELIHALRTVAPVTAIVFTVSFLIGVIAKFAAAIDVTAMMTPIYLCALVMLWRKRAKILAVIAEQVRLRLARANSNHQREKSDEYIT